LSASRASNDVRPQWNAALGIALSVAVRGPFAFDNRHVRFILNHHKVENRVRSCQSNRTLLSNLCKLGAGSNDIACRTPRRRSKEIKHATPHVPHASSSGLYSRFLRRSPGRSFVRPLRRRTPVSRHLRATSTAGLEIAVHPRHMHQQPKSSMRADELAHAVPERGCPRGETRPMCRRKTRRLLRGMRRRLEDVHRSIANAKLIRLHGRAVIFRSTGYRG
jgi:hypothetical protein